MLCRHVLEAILWLMPAWIWTCSSFRAGSLSQLTLAVKVTQKGDKEKIKSVGTKTPSSPFDATACWEKFVLWIYTVNKVLLHIFHGPLFHRKGELPLTRIFSEEESKLARVTSCYNVASVKHWRWCPIWSMWKSDNNNESNSSDEDFRSFYDQYRIP